MRPAQLLRSLFDAAVAAAQPAACVPPRLPSPPPGRTVVVGAGKAAAAMALALEQHWPGHLDGVVVTRYGHGLPCDRIRVIEAAHPLPDANSVAAGQHILQAVSGLTEDDLVIVLLSGGGSALLTLPLPGVTLADKIAINQALLASGASIDAVNCVRKHLSAVKGGRLAHAAAPARMVTLAISDVPGDDPSVIASGPTCADPTTQAQALGILETHSINVPQRIRALLSDPRHETPKPGAALFEASEFHIVARPADSLGQAAIRAEAAGYEVQLLGDAIQGEAAAVAREHAALARAAVPGTLLLSGGELTVTHAGTGRGGPNTEYLLSLLQALGPDSRVHALAADTDGRDGSEDNAGATIGPDSLRRGVALGLDAAGYLARHDAYTYFATLGDLLETGPTYTNVNDFRALLID